MKTTIDEMCAVMQAFRSGKQVQWRNRLAPIPWSCGGPDVERDLPWGNDDNPTWNWGANEYRIKPEPIELWLVAWDTDGRFSYWPYDRLQQAEAHVHSGQRIIHMREVFHGEV